MNVRLVCAFASSSCIGTEPAAYVEENVESENTDFRAVGRGPRQRPGMGRVQLQGVHTRRIEPQSSANNYLPS